MPEFIEQDHQGTDLGRLDMLIISPCLDWKFEQERKIGIRLEKNLPNQETPHIGVAYLLAIAKREGLKVKYIDMAVDRLTQEQLLVFINETRPVVVGFTAFTIQIRTAALIATAIKKKFPDMQICIGGCHVTAIPKETLQEFPVFDFIVCGEGELILSRIIYAIEGKKDLSHIKGVVTRNSPVIFWEPVKNLDDLPFPAWEEFDISKYPGTYPHRTKLELPMISSRGCPYQCVFCCRALGGKIRQRSVASVIAEIEHNVEKFGCKSIVFLDETFLAEMKWAKEFFSVLIARGLNKKITWSCSTRVSRMSLEFLNKMKEAGCYYIFFGIESADDDTLKRIKKNITIEQVKNAIKWTKQAGIIPVGAFIIGLPGDTEEKVFKAIELAKGLDLYSVTFPIAVPFPGTELREMAIKKEFGMRIMSNDWNDYGKQDPGVLESLDLPWKRRKELQKIAYQHHPKKHLDAYLESLKDFV